MNKREARILSRYNIETVERVKSCIYLVSDGFHCEFPKQCFFYEFLLSIDNEYKDHYVDVAPLCKLIRSKKGM